MSGSWKVVCLVAIAVVLVGVTVAADQAPLDRAKSFLGPNGPTVLLPMIGFGTAVGASRDALVVAEPAAVTAFRDALETDPSLVTSDDIAIRRLLNLKSAWESTLGSPRYNIALSRLVDEIELVRTDAQDFNKDEAVRFVLDNNVAGLREALQVSEMGFAIPLVATGNSIEAIPCFDCNYHSCGMFWRANCCLGGEGCCISVACPESGSGPGGSDLAYRELN